MNKELEALGRIEKEIDDFKEMAYPMDYIKKDDFNVIKQALTPPTADEVCKALSEYYEIPVKYNHGNFYYGDELTYFEITDNDCEDVNGKTLYRINNQLPSHLITMIGRFYEAQIIE